MDAAGEPAHPGDMRKQIDMSMDNLETVLEQAGFALSDLMQLRYYTVDVDRFSAEYDAVTGRLEAAGCRPAATLPGVQRLAFPELLVEIEVTAVQ